MASLPALAPFRDVGDVLIRDGLADGAPVAIGAQVASTPAPAETSADSPVTGEEEGRAADAGTDGGPLGHAPVHVGAVVLARAPVAGGPRETPADRGTFTGVAGVARAYLAGVPAVVAATGTARLTASARPVRPDIPVADAPGRTPAAARLHAVGAQGRRVPVARRPLAAGLLLPASKTHVVPVAVPRLVAARLPAHADAPAQATEATARRGEVPVGAALGLPAHEAVAQGLGEVGLLPDGRVVVLGVGVAVFPPATPAAVAPVPTTGVAGRRPTTLTHVADGGAVPARRTGIPPPARAAPSPVVEVLGHVGTPLGAVAASEAVQVVDVTLPRPTRAAKAGGGGVALLPVA